MLLKMPYRRYRRRRQAGQIAGACDTLKLPKTDYKRNKTGKIDKKTMLFLLLLGQILVKNFRQ